MLCCLFLLKLAATSQIIKLLHFHSLLHLILLLHQSILLLIASRFLIFMLLLVISSLLVNLTLLGMATEKAGKIVHSFLGTTTFGICFLCNSILHKTPTRLPTHTVQALPLALGLPFGCGSTVMIKRKDNSGM